MLMSKLGHLSWSLPVLVLLVGWLLATPAGAAPVDYTLTNGLKVILIENHRAPVVSMMTWVKVGSADETPSEYGLAHLMEHMLFKGTTHRAPGQIAREIEAAGGQINAFTSYDQTVYHIDIASRFASKGLDVLGDMVLFPTLDPEEYAREKEVVIEEIRRGEDSPERKLSRAVFGGAFKVHPYGRPVIGTSEGVAGISRETAVGFHKKWYQPGNIILVMAGDFDPGQIRLQIEKIFGQVPATPVARAARPVEPAQTGPRVEIVRADVKTAQIQVGFHIPGFKSDDTIPMDLLALVAGEGRASRLYLQVKRGKELVNEVGASSYTPEDPGLYIVSAHLAPEKVRPALAAIMAEMSDLARSGATSDELNRAKLNTKADHIQHRATMYGEAETAASYEALAGDFRFKDKYLSQVEAASGEALQAAARKYLKPENMTIGVLLPKNAESDLDQVAILAVANQGWSPARASLVAGAEPEQRLFKLKNGIRLIVKADQSLPLVSVRVAFLGGVRYETERDNGVNNFLAKVWDKGTTRLSAEALAKATEDMAAQIGSYSGRNSFGLEGDFLSQDLDRGLALLAEVMTTPALAPAEVEKARPNILADIARQKDQPANRAFKLFARTLYGSHPYALDQAGTPETVTRLKATDIRAYYQRFVRPDGAVISVVGQVDPDAVKEKIANLLEGWRGTSPILPTPVIGRQPTWTGLKSGQEIMERAQTHLILGFPAPGLENPDRYPLEVLNAVLSGMGGRLFIKLRDEQSLAYSLTSFYRPGLEAGVFGLYMAFEPAKQAQALAGFQGILAGLLTDPITPEELAGAKEYILGSYEIGLQTYEAQASESAFNELYGLGLDYPKKYVAGINAVTQADLIRVTKQYLDQNRSARVLVGPLKDGM